MYQWFIYPKFFKKYKNKVYSIWRYVKFISADAKNQNLVIKTNIYTVYIYIFHEAFFSQINQFLALQVYKQD